MAPFEFTKSQELKNFDFSEKKHGFCFLGQTMYSSVGIYASRNDNSAAYCQTFKRLRRAIQNKRRGMLTNGVRLLHDNARPYTALVTKALLKQFKWEVLDHPPYSPDLAPIDFHLFRYLKSHLSGKSFRDDDEIKDEVEMWLRQQAATFYVCGIQKLVHRLNKCLDNGGDYVEK
ncbi:histone-lysine N-methyltransferase SETMAR [Trichonephila clavipes]|nr:histone-lysine N-methyltransferase SETMAR [Trichonephila clavipes]